ncbi:hypothetical protein BDN71DRAFT_1427529 [Pleurotus eryngii]|uniref:SHSP domain-containing protein n=1 Tax=Pleurotus eryngii TaxID=5323 RepID=A0A9P6DBB7_PLEER|nr:hypothetical protein BDN71DRAFT_1427529 [Pleurotus eryngii]
MADFSQDVVGSEQTKSPKATKGSRAKGSLRVTRGKTSKKVQDRGDGDGEGETIPKTPQLSLAEITPEPTETQVEMGNQVESSRNDTATTTPETQAVQPPSLIGHDNQVEMGNQVESSREDKATTITTSIKPMERIGDQLDIHEPIVYESASKDTIEFVVILPGIHADRVSVTFAEGFSIVAAEKAIVKMNDGPVITEHKTVRLEYKKILPKGIQAEGIRAWTKNGMLTVTCPAKDTTPQLIQIHQ